MGRLTTQPIAWRTRAAPGRPGQIEVQIALGAGAQALIRDGINLNVSIGLDIHTVTALRAQNLPVPSPVTCRALIDTGASMLALDTSVIQSLNLIRRGVAPCHTASGTRLANLYTVSMSFPGTDFRPYNMLRAIDVNLSAQPFKCLIGWETMANWFLHYNGQSGAISISD